MARQSRQPDKAGKLLGRADRERREAFIERVRLLLAAVQRDQGRLVYLDEAHIHQDADLGYGWGERGKRLHVASTSPGLSARVSFHGLSLFNEGQVGVWPYPRANGEHTIDVLRRLRLEFPEGALTLIWDGAPYHRAKAVWAEAARLGITFLPLPGYSPDLMPVEALWRWLREDVTCNHRHATADDLIRRVVASRQGSTSNPAPSLIASGSRNISTQTRKNYGSQVRRGIT